MQVVSKLDISKTEIATNNSALIERDNHLLPFFEFVCNIGVNINLFNAPRENIIETSVKLPVKIFPYVVLNSCEISSKR